MDKTTLMIQSPELRVVEASAGSGKTFALAKRYVQLMLMGASADAQSIRQVLAITFTNKASFEMKARILDFLKRVALDLLPANQYEEILGALNMDRQAACQRARQVMEEIILNYNFFQVQTIDSFINALLSGCAFKIGLSARFKIRRDAFEYIRYSLDRTIDRAVSDPQVLGLFENFLRQYLFLENKTGWFPKKDIQGMLFALYQQSNTYAKDFALFPLSEDLLAMKARTFQKFKDLRAACPAEGLDKGFLKSFDKFLGKYHRGFDFDEVPEYFARPQFPMKAGHDIPKLLQDAWEDLFLSLRAVSEAEACASFNPYVEIFYKVLAEFKAVSRQDDVLFLEELNKKAHQLFEDEGITAGELYYRLATRFRHYLIDEFQDTSLLQWSNLYTLAQEALSTGGTVFYVGDKKQAIYGFRGGEVRLFDEVKGSFKEFNVREEILETNYRSLEAVVEFNNHIFSLQNLQRFVKEKEAFEEEKDKKDSVRFQEKDLERLSSLFAHSRQKTLPQKKGGRVRVRYVPGSSAAEREETVRQDLLQQVRQLRERYACHEIAVLTRDNQDVERVTAWLSAEGFPVESERTLNIKEHSVIRQLVSLLKFLNSPADNIAFASFILGDVFCLAAGVSREEMRDFIFSQRPFMRKDGTFYLYKAFSGQYPRLWQEHIEVYFKRAGFYPVYELAVSVIGGFKVFSNFEDQQGFVMQFLEMIKCFEREANDLMSFLDYYETNERENLFVNVGGSDSVRVMTVHKAKGLEFPVVLLPFFEMSVKVGQTSGSDLGQRAFIVDKNSDTLGLYRIKSKYLRFSRRLAAVRAGEYVDSFFSELNNAYVALTRAVEELFIWVPERAGSSINLAGFLIPEDLYDVGASGPRDGRVFEKGHDAGHAALSSPVYRDWISFLEEEFKDDGQGVRNRSQVRRGTIVHALLQNLGSAKGLDLEQWQKSVTPFLRGKFPSVADLSPYFMTVRELIAREDVAELFFVDEKEVFCEQEIVDRSGRAHRLDRLIVQGHRVCVVDYKMSSLQKEEHLRQVKAYMDLVGQMFPGRAVEGVILYLDGFSKVAVQ
ncbi:MAG TPA: UvrD-helicase domain-containing protein [Candidatus Omnitrophota bacterium]|nr:UvrD-helicase domain-containing protein [Candidatus Omnitrophota bacterium]